MRKQERRSSATSLPRRPDLSSISRRHRCPLPLCLVADGQIVAAVVTGIETAGAAALAAFGGTQAANRNTKVVDERAKKTAEWQRIDRLVSMACSENPKEAYVGLYHLQQSRADWNNDPDQRAHIRRTLEALNAPAVQAYRGGQTTVVTTPPPPAQPGSP